ncbi:PIN domain-containing protein [Treponema primitia]|uniref:type II toxin-antitoxin system VapC family toxin n=1 Tax=Treponema primitia TaxID=88058 RepID=UPI00397FCAA3
MSEKIFLDSDIILDVLAEREKFLAPAAELFEMGISKKVELFTTAVALANVFYILRKTAGFEKTKEKFKKLRLLIHILPINENVVDFALDSEFSDFEDGLQYFTAKENKISTIITRNVKDFKRKDIVIQTADEFIKAK